MFGGHVTVPQPCCGGCTMEIYLHTMCWRRDTQLNAPSMTYSDVPFQTCVESCTFSRVTCHCLTPPQINAPPKITLCAVAHTSSNCKLWVSPEYCILVILVHNLRLSNAAAISPSSHYAHTTGIFFARRCCDAVARIPQDPCYTSGSHATAAASMTSCGTAVISAAV